MWLFSRRRPGEEGYDPIRDGPTTSSPSLWTSNPFNETDSKREIAFVDGNVLTAVEFLDQLLFLPSVTWPTFEKAEDVIEIADEAMYDRVQSMEARKLGYQKRPEVMRRS
jgi:hypothetical protein